MNPLMVKAEGFIVLVIFGFVGSEASRSRLKEITVGANQDNAFQGELTIE